ncbi:MAG: STAS domain-containing protein [Acidimicrobiales bacterium]
MDTAEPPFEVASDASRPSVLVVRGELDAVSAPQLRRALDDARSAGADEVRIDLSDVTFIDSSGLQAITAALRELRDEGRDLRVEGASRAVRRIFEVTGLRNLLLTD